MALSLACLTALEASLMWPLAPLPNLILESAAQPSTVEGTILSMVAPPFASMSVEKVTGAAEYTVDVHLDGMLEARLLRSPHAHARVLKLDTSTAERVAGDGARSAICREPKRRIWAPTILHRIGCGTSPQLFFRAHVWSA